ncbi:MAG TPA: hypothetical protein ENH40_00250 [Nitrospirae bacterium]|nr:hypothetical protein [Nitrospirota bacterium]
MDDVKDISQLAIENVADFLDEEDVLFWAHLFVRLSEIENAEKLFRRIKNARSKNQVLDYLAEARYALIFYGLGFSVKYEPLGYAGPDLKVERDGAQAVVEVKNCPPNELDSELEEFDEEEDELETLPEIGDLMHDSDAAYLDIANKFRQIKKEQAIIAIWSDRITRMEIEFDLACRRMVSEEFKPENLLFILYGSQEVNISKQQQLFVYPMEKLKNPFSKWSEDLEGIFVNHLLTS